MYRYGFLDLKTRASTDSRALKRPTSLSRVVGVFASVFLCLLSTQGNAQTRLNSQDYISPTARGIRPRFHKPVLPSPTISLHGLSSFPIGSGDNLTSQIQPGPGFRLSAAWQPSREIAAEISYRASTHETLLSESSDRGFFQGLHVGATLYPLEKDDEFRPHISIGTHALGYFSDRITEDKMLGFGIDLGGGVGIFLSRHTCINIGLRYLGTFVYSADSDFFDQAEGSNFVNQISPEIGLTFYP